MQDNIIIVIQARMGSSRLPGKVLLPVWGKSLLMRMIERVQRTQYPVTIVIATSTDPEDDVIEDEAFRNDIPCYRGSLNNLLERHYDIARKYHADLLLKIPSDCPLIDPVVIDEALDLFYERSNRYDYISNLHPATYPDGNDVEIMTMACIERVYKEAALPWELEHTTPYIWEHPEQFRIGNLLWKTGLNLSMSHRFTIDYPEDYEFILQVFKKLYPVKPAFSCNDILQLLEDNPKIYEINACHAGVNWYRHHLADLKTVTAAQTKVIP